MSHWSRRVLALGVRAPAPTVRAAFAPSAPRTFSEGFDYPLVRMAKLLGFARI